MLSTTNKVDSRPLCHLMLALLIQAIALYGYRGAQAYSFNDTRLSNSSSHKIHQQSFANHRMDNDSLLGGNNISLHQLDREPAGSVLQPQVALQIFAANPIVQDGSRGSQSNNGRAPPAMVIVPIQQQSQKSSSLHGDDLHSEQQSHQSRGKSSSASRLDPWRYVTDQQPDGHHSESSYHNSARSSPGQAPLINAIITVPSPGGDHQFGYSSSNHGEHRRDEDDRHSLNGSVLEQSISRLMDHQAAGNLEFTMNLNGEQITINPKSNKARILAMINKDIKESHGEQLVDTDHENAGLPRKFSSRNKDSSNRAIRAHIHSDLVGDQQSASEIDLVDGMAENGSSTASSNGANSANNMGSSDSGADESETEFERSNNQNGKDSTEEKAGKTKEVDTGEIADGGREDRGSRDKAWLLNGQSSIDSSQSEDPERSFDEQSTDEVSSETNRNSNSNHNIGRSESSDSAEEKIPKKRRVFMNRKFSGSKRKVTSHKSNDKDSDSDVETRAPSKRSQDGEPSVVIKGEDVRRFELLLENLRTLSNMNNKAKARRARKESQMKVQRVVQPVEPMDEDEQFNNKPEEVPVTQKTPKAGRFSTRNQSPMSRNSESDGNIDCGRRRQKQHQLQKAASSSNEDTSVPYEQDSSPNIVDQDPITSSDGGDVLVDETARSAEQEEQSSDNHNRMSPSMDIMQDTTDTAESTMPRQQLVAEEPKPVMVRKTVLQDYYDSEANQAGGMATVSSTFQPDDLRSIHNSQHEALHGRHIREGASGDQPSVAGYRRQSFMSVKHSQLPQSSVVPSQSAQEEYAESMQTSDEINRAMESRKVKTFVLPQKLAMNVRPLRQLIEKTVERPRSRSISLRI